MPFCVEMMGQREEEACFVGFYLIKKACVLLYLFLIVDSFKEGFKCPGIIVRHFVFIRYRWLWVSGNKMADENTSTFRAFL